MQFALAAWAAWGELGCVHDWPRVEQGSLHYTPEHCLVNGEFPLFW